MAENGFETGDQVYEHKLTSSGCGSVYLLHWNLVPRLGESPVVNLYFHMVEETVELASIEGFELEVTRGFRGFDGYRENQAQTKKFIQNFDLVAGKTLTYYNVRGKDETHLGLRSMVE